MNSTDTPQTIADALHVFSDPWATDEMRTEAARTIEAGDADLARQVAKDPCAAAVAHFPNVDHRGYVVGFHGDGALAFDYVPDRDAAHRHPGRVFCRHGAPIQRTANR
ncbi:hypothetical protein [Tsukamurella sp. 1534]|uniref:hypothetical protein n=1 Tax=Tsukamurella sp. 1534 TaxID=1151061 RepID=UPI00031BE94F|nr:hypothetical protein [Tsukamurella sp. 1534]